MADERKTHIIVTGKGGGGGGTQVQSDWTETDNTSMAYIQNKPTLADVATSGDYDDLENKPTILTQWFGTQAEYDAITTKDPNTIYNIEGNQVDWTEISNKPSFATVATSGSYNDLSNTPTIPAEQVQSNWTETDNTSKAYIQNKPTVPSNTETLTFTLSDSTTRTITFYTT